MIFKSKLKHFWFFKIQIFSSRYAKKEEKSLSDDAEEVSSTSKIEPQSPSTNGAVETITSPINDSIEILQEDGQVQTADDCVKDDVIEVKDVSMVSTDTADTGGENEEIVTISWVRVNIFLRRFIHWWKLEWEWRPWIPHELNLKLKEKKLSQYD